MGVIEDIENSHKKKTVAKFKVELNPDFQRNHCWTPKQRREYIEYCLRGGKTGHDIYFNQMGSLHNLTHPYVC